MLSSLSSGLEPEKKIEGGNLPKSPLAGLLTGRTRTSWPSVTVCIVRTTSEVEVVMAIILLECAQKVASRDFIVVIIYTWDEWIGMIGRTWNWKSSWLRRKWHGGCQWVRESRHSLRDTECTDSNFKLDSSPTSRKLEDWLVLSLESSFVLGLLLVTWTLNLQVTSCSPSTLAQSTLTTIFEDTSRCES